jgi:hypothetical protein
MAIEISISGRGVERIHGRWLLKMKLNPKNETKPKKKNEAKKESWFRGAGQRGRAQGQIRAAGQKGKIKR